MNPDISSKAMCSNPHYSHGLLWRAIVLSLLLHALLLLQPGFKAATSNKAAAQLLVALLQPTTETPLPEAAVPAVPVSQSHQMHKPVEVREATRATPSVAAFAKPPAPAMADMASTPIANADASNTANDTAPATTGNVEPDFEKVRQSYLFAVAAEAERVKKYPPRAMAAGWTGMAEIRVVVGAGGNIQTPRLGKSSGYADIDYAALSFVGIALKRTPLPESLRRHDFDFVVPVSFSINEQ